MTLQYTRVTENEGEGAKILLRDFTYPHREAFIRVGEEKVVLPIFYINFADAIKNFEVRNDDVWVITHPKTGTTWTQEMVWCIANDLDYEGAKEDLTTRFPYIDFSQLVDFKKLLEKHPDPSGSELMKDSVSYVSKLPSPRFIKCHLPWSLLPQQIQDGTKQPKIIYTCRNAKDTCLSFYHHIKMMEGFRGNFEDFCVMFLEDSVHYNPFWSHLFGFWNRRDHKNILFLKYEDMKKDHPSVIRKTAEFLGKTLSDDQVQVLTDHLSFESMRNNKAVNYDEAVEFCRRSFGYVSEKGNFIRSGRVGEGKEKMSSEMSSKFDAWIEENLRGTGLEW